MAINTQQTSKVYQAIDTLQKTMAAGSKRALGSSAKLEITSDGDVILKVYDERGEMILNRPITPLEIANHLMAEG